MGTHNYSKGHIMCPFLYDFFNWLECGWSLALSSIALNLLPLELIHTAKLHDFRQFI